jgi:ribokinase
VAAEASILSLGSLNLDFEMRVERWPDPGESLPTRDFVAAGGGKAANVAFCARKLGVPSVLLARMGEDIFGRMALQPLEQAGVDVRYVRCSAGEASGVALIAVQPDGEKTILLAANANAHWSAQDVIAVEAAVQEAAAGSVLVADLEVPAHVVRTIARACRERGFKVILDPSPARAMEPDLYALCDCITPNPGEAAALVGFAVRTPQDGLRASKVLRERGSATVLTKLPDGGCVLYESSAAQWLRAPQVEPGDKTGAGDAFAGALAVGILSQCTPEEAARMAVAAATVAVTRYGTQASYPDRAELERLMHLVRIESIRVGV